MANKIKSCPLSHPPPVASVAIRLKAVDLFVAPGVCGRFFFIWSLFCNGELNVFPSCATTLQR